MSARWQNRVSHSQKKSGHDETELVAIRRRLAEIEEDQRIANETSHVAWQDIKHVANSYVSGLYR